MPSCGDARRTVSDPTHPPRQGSKRLSQIGGRRSISVSGRTSIRGLASSAASNVSAAANAAASNASASAGSVASSMSAVVSASVAAASSAVATGRRSLGRPRRRMSLPAPLQRPHSPPVRRLSVPAVMREPSSHLSDQLPHLALEGPAEERPPLSLHNCGLIRWIFEEAKTIHTARPEYQARQCDTTREDNMHMKIFREVCTDVMAATRQCCNAYRAVESMSEAAARRRESRVPRLAKWLQKVKGKLFAAATLAKLLAQMREDSAKAELMWKQCCDGLGSLSLNSKAFASRSLGAQSFRPCGNISLSLRKYRRATPSP